jgi:hypothetical protein
VISGVKGSFPREVQGQSEKIWNIVEGKTTGTNFKRTGSFSFLPFFPAAMLQNSQATWKILQPTAPLSCQHPCLLWTGATKPSGMADEHSWNPYCMEVKTAPTGTSKPTDLLAEWKKMGVFKLLSLRMIT